MLPQTAATKHEPDHSVTPDHTASDGRDARSRGIPHDRSSPLSPHDLNRDTLLTSANGGEGESSEHGPGVIRARSGSDPDPVDEGRERRRDPPGRLPVRRRITPGRYGSLPVVYCV